ncbi:MAG: hypothetical protein ACREEW_05560, partial [Caulobacteraceae bacterium]
AFLDAAFALHDGRLRPYPKYLAWELATWPLARFPIRSEDLLARLSAVLKPDGGAFALRDLVALALPAFRQAGHGAVLDAWEDALDWTLAWRQDRP